MAVWLSGWLLQCQCWPGTQTTTGAAIKAKAVNQTDGKDSRQRMDGHDSQRQGYRESASGCEHGKTYAECDVTKQRSIGRIVRSSRIS